MSSGGDTRRDRRERLERWSNRALIGALALGLATPALFAAAALGSKFGLWNWRFGLGVMTRDWGTVLGYTAVAAGVGSLALALAASRRRAALLSLAAIAIPAVVLASFAAARKAADELPPFYDVQTDWTRSIAFSARTMELRERLGANPVRDDARIAPDDRRAQWAGRSNADAQAEAYPEIRPLILDLPIERSLEYVREVAAAQPGWEVTGVRIDGDRALLEATATTFWYGLVDDVAVRLSHRPDGKTRVDVRSVGREGHIDLGMHAERISRFMRELEAAVP